MWWQKKTQSDDPHDLSRMEKIRESQIALINAATSTADAAHDVTTKLKARLDDSLRQLELTANLLSDALIICKSDGTIQSFNPAAQKIFGWNLREIEGQSIANLFLGSRGRSIHPSEIFQFLQEHKGYLEELKYFPRVGVTKGRRNNGELFYVAGDITYLERQDGSTIVMVLVRDITTRVELQKQLNVSEKNYRNIFESNFDGIIVVCNSLVVAANPAAGALLKYSTDQMISRPAIDFFDVEFHKTINEINQSYQRNIPSLRNFVSTGVTSTGEKVGMLFTSALMHWEGVPSSLIAIKDITELVKAINETK